MKKFDLTTSPENSSLLKEFIAAGRNSSGQTHFPLIINNKAQYKKSWQAVSGSRQIASK
jgi:hypothetical protein